MYFWVASETAPKVNDDQVIDTTSLHSAAQHRIVVSPASVSSSRHCDDHDMGSTSVSITTDDWSPGVVATFEEKQVEVTAIGIFFCAPKLLLPVVAVDALSREEGACL